MIINNQLSIYYDLHDSYEIDLIELKNVDIYFKRSYFDTYISQMKDSESKKIFPLGLNYWVYPNKIDFFNIERALFLLKGKDRITSLMKAINLPSSITNSPKLSNLEDTPPFGNKKKNNKILFMARTWDPYSIDDISENKINEFLKINETRASSIRELKKEFGKDFYGGFSHTDYAIKNYKDCLMPNQNLSNKKQYLNLLKEYPICIATTGLHNSIGWKFAEYVAMSKAIISEKLIYSIPGNFKEGKNYLEFKTSEEVIAQTLQLHNDAEKRYDIMLNNSRYYYDYLKPDTLVYNSLLTALSNFE